MGEPVLQAISSSSRFAKLVAGYRRIFSISEIESDLAVRLFGGAVLLGFLLTYNIWQADTSTGLDAVRSGSATCWPFFQNCYDYYFLRSLPYGYTQTSLYMVLFGVIMLAAYALLASRFVLAHACILVLFLWKCYVSIVSFHFHGNYDYYHTAFTITFLFLPHKRFFASVSLPLFYFLSTAGKIHETWALGTYFSAMHTGLPWIPDALIPLATNIVIFMEMVGAWFLLSKNPLLQRTAFAFFVFFHLYSGILVGYRYPTTVLPALLILFGPLYKPFEFGQFARVPLNWKAMPGWSYVLVLMGLQAVPLAIPGDEKLTLEANFYGLYMFEANHQCIVEIKDQDRVLFNISSNAAHYRCDPYSHWFRATRRYCQSDPDRVLSFRLDHSINGGPFYRIVDEADLCRLQYKAFSKNDWIKTEATAEAVGRPHKNLYTAVGRRNRVLQPASP
jgi:hypothetical protein